MGVICIEVVVKGTRGNEGPERSGVHDEEEWAKDRALWTPQEDVCQEDRSVTHLTQKGRDESISIRTDRVVKLGTFTLFNVGSPV